MTWLSDEVLNDLLKTDSSKRLVNSENEFLEFKREFNRNTKEEKAKYVRELAALYNTNGGYVVFGVNDEGILIGLENFTAPDPAEISQDIKTYFQPGFSFSSRTFSTQGCDVFIIHVTQRKSIPSVSTLGFDRVLSPATIYWRYTGQSAPIHWGDLVNLLHELKGELTERRTDIEATRLKLEHKPLLKVEGGISMQDIAKPKVVNHGKRAHIKSINVLEGSVTCHPYQKIPFTIEENGQFIMEVRSGGNIMNAVRYKLEFLYTDELQTPYRSVAEFLGGTGKMSEPEEIS